MTDGEFGQWRVKPARTRSKADWTPVREHTLEPDWSAVVTVADPRSSPHRASFS